MRKTQPQGQAGLQWTELKVNMAANGSRKRAVLILKPCRRSRPSPNRLCHNQMVCDQLDKCCGEDCGTVIYWLPHQASRSIQPLWFMRSWVTVNNLCALNFLLTDGFASLIPRLNKYVGDKLHFIYWRETWDVLLAFFQDFQNGFRSRTPLLQTTSGILLALKSGA